MIKEYDIIVKLIQRYDYSGALEIMNDQGLDSSNAAVLMDSCRYAINFDFSTAKKLLRTLPQDFQKEPEIKWLKENLKELISGEIEPMFSELLENIRFKIVNQEFIDFLGRINRCREAIFKYMFVKKHINRTQFNFHVEVMQKRYILKILKKQYKIYNNNIVFGITTYINRNMKVDYKYSEVVKILNAAKMSDLIELRNDSIVGHGFVGVGKEEIYKAYGNPYWIIDDFKTCLSLLDLDIEARKYDRINRLIARELEVLSRSSSPIYMGEHYTFE